MALSGGIGDYGFASIVIQHSVTGIANKLSLQANCGLNALVLPRLLCRRCHQWDVDGTPLGGGLDSTQLPDISRESTRCLWSWFRFTPNWGSDAWD